MQAKGWLNSFPDALIYEQILGTVEAFLIQNSIKYGMYFETHTSTCMLHTLQINLYASKYYYVKTVHKKHYFLCNTKLCWRHLLNTLTIRRSMAFVG
ncbi:hypothetical protein V1478_012375 [Vespula squamosa]|uniref:Uncharacterized protein n=1 Tax=Vespula squamosa TaxID=30214 RepID=A0ABD2AD04_VESSQ